jgi:tRNA modification GTPase
VVGILRISGLKARDVAQAVLGKLPKPRYADYLPFNDVDGTPLDQGIALWFPGPNSFTGEDVLELQGHGGPVILDLLLKRILTLPAYASPGRASFPSARSSTTSSTWRRQKPSPTSSTPVQNRRRARR